MFLGIFGWLQVSHTTKTSNKKRFFGENCFSTRQSCFLWWFTTKCFGGAEARTNIPVERERGGISRIDVQLHQCCSSSRQKSDFALLSCAYYKTLRTKNLFWCKMNPEDFELEGHLISPRKANKTAPQRNIYRHMQFWGLIALFIRKNSCHYVLSLQQTSDEL